MLPMRLTVPGCVVAEDSGLAAVDHRRFLRGCWWRLTSGHIGSILILRCQTLCLGDGLEILLLLLH